MSGRGHYGHQAVIGNGFLSEPEPGEEFATCRARMKYRLESKLAFWLPVAALTAIGVGGIVGLGVQAFSKPKTAVPVTSSQKVVRLGLVGAVVGAGAYAYFTDQSSQQPPTAPQTPKPLAVPARR